ncbi:MAG: hypothetical protein J0H36_02195 [Hyphomicrobium denitrificans]|nr:hypothetical protein [Hyphomicrobium denitrificans]
MKTTLTVALAAAAMMLGAGVASAHDKTAKGVHHHHAHHAHHAANHKHAAKHAKKHAAKKAHKHAAKHGHKHVVSKKAVKKAG